MVVFREIMVCTFPKNVMGVDRTYMARVFNSPDTIPTSCCRREVQRKGPFSPFRNRAFPPEALKWTRGSSQCGTSRFTSVFRNISHPYKALLPTEGSQGVIEEGDEEILLDVPDGGVAESQGNSTA
jgi:hypothetical protein